MLKRLQDRQKSRTQKRRSRPREKIQAGKRKRARTVGSTERERRLPKRAQTECENEFETKAKQKGVGDFGMEPATGMESWQELGVPLPIIRALNELGFVTPTEIQRRAIPVAMDTTRDVIGAAETVSRVIVVQLNR